MRKVIVSLVIVVLLVGAYLWAVKNAQVSFSALEGKIVQAERGDLVIPITASGNIKPASVTQIKSKASGEVVELPFEVGAMVKKGELVVRLLDVDEQNSVDRAQADYERAKIELDKAEIAKDEAERVGILAAKAKQAQAEARLAVQEWNYKKQQQLKAIKAADGTFDASSEMEFEVDFAQFREAKASKQAADVELNQAEIAVNRAKKNIETAEQNLKTAKKTLDDALERLKETKVYSPIDGMVLVRNVQKGEVIQGGKTMFTGGTVLLEIADVSQIFAVVNVDEADIGQVRELAPVSARPGSIATRPATLPSEMVEGEPVEVTVESFKDEKFSGVIERISPQSEVVQAIATFKVWIRIDSDNRDKLVSLLNTQAEAHFTARAVKDAVLVDYEAFQKDPNSDTYGVYVPYVPPGKNIPEPKFIPCKFGDDNGIKVEVRQGLQPGDKVYTKLPQKTKKEKEAEEESESE